MGKTLWEGAFMFSRKGLALVTACAAMACGGLVRADIAPASVTNIASSPLMMDDAQPVPPASAPAATATSTPAPGGLLMNALRGIKIGDGLDSLGIVATGYVEGSWTYSAHIPPGNILTDRAFDTKTESIQFDAVELLISKGVTYTNPFDIGFNIEGLYGADGAYTHSNGLTVYSPGKTSAGGVAAIHPKNQLDLIQANVTLGFHIGYGLGFEAGKFDTLLGYEVIDAPLNGLYSHSYIFTQEPYTHTGVLAIYNVTDPASANVVTATGGFTRGWDQATDDNNGSVDYTGQLLYKNVDPTSSATNYSIALNAITGDEQPHGPQDGWRTVLDVVGTYNFSDQLTFGLNGMYAWQAQSAQGGTGNGTGSWYGTALYAKYTPPNQSIFAINMRGEWFDDQDGAAPTQYGVPGISAYVPNQYYEATIGLTVTPFPSDPNLKGLAIRPELRWDYSDHAAFDGGSQHDQWTAAVEAYFAF
jgi:hypothetical protein